MSTKILKGVEIFSSGKWNGLSFTNADLDSMVESFDALDLSGKLPLKLGHEGPDGRVATSKRNKDGTLKDPLSQLSMGWVNRIYREGTLLLADLEVSERVAKLFDDKHLKFVSVELLEEVRAGRGVFPWVLDAVALLGTDTPAVGILSDIQALTMTRSAVPLPHRASAVFTRENETNHGVRKYMAEKEITLESLAQQMLQLTQNVADLKNENTALKADKVRGEQAEVRFTTLQKEVEAKNIKDHRQMISDALDNAVRTQEITPAAALRFKKSYRTEDDAVVLEVSKADVLEFIKENPNPKKPTETRRTFRLDKVNGDVPEGTRGDQEAHMRTLALLEAQGKHEFTDVDFERAAIQVLTSNEGCKDRYKKFTADAHGTKYGE